MTITPINAASPATQTQAQPGQGRGLDFLGQGDFLRLMTVQMQQQDPFDPVDQTQMLAQMAQFSSVAGIADVNAKLQTIAGTLDALLAAQQASALDAGEPSPSNPSTTPTQEI